MSKALEQLQDRFAITDVLHRYGSAIDHKDWPALRSCFAADSRALYAGQQEWLEGGDAIVDWIDRMTVHAPWQHHFLSVARVRVEGDEARALTYLVSSQRTDDEPARMVRMLGTYTDLLRRTPEGWRIASRELSLGWAEHSDWPTPPAVAAAR